MFSSTVLMKCATCCLSIIRRHYMISRIAHNQIHELSDSTLNRLAWKLHALNQEKKQRPRQVLILSHLIESMNLYVIFQFVHLPTVCRALNLSTWPCNVTQLNEAYHEILLADNRICSFCLSTMIHGMPTMHGLTFIYCIVHNALLFFSLWLLLTTIFFSVWFYLIWIYYSYIFSW
jgi:hypothetical protein